ncbi:hypothetical protein V6N13_068943 [Hibiscus sabdariffa]
MASVILSPDLICEILRRSSVKDLLRFRCVSKAWRSLIDDSGFIKLHLSHSLETSTNLSLLLSLCGKGNIYSVNFASLKTAQRLKFPGDESGGRRDFAVLGSCNGLLALLERKDAPLELFKRFLCKRTEEFYLWNPSTRKSQMLPASELGLTPHFFSAPHVFHGFGYDPISDDYKLVRIVQCFCLVPDLSESDVMVYSLKTKNWSRKEDFPFYVKYTRTNAVLANNALHWEASTKSEPDPENFDADFDLIAAFDLGTEEYRVIELPDCLCERLTTNINVMGGCLCLIASYREVGVADIWVMKEYGVKESWTKFISVETQCFEDRPDVLPLVYSKNGDKVLLLVGGMLFFYDLRSKKADKVEIEDVPGLFKVEMMVESLVPLNGNGAMLDKNQHGGKTKRKNTERDDILSNRIHQSIIFRFTEQDDGTTDFVLLDALMICKRNCLFNAMKGDDAFPAELEEDECCSMTIFNFVCYPQKIGSKCCRERIGMLYSLVSAFNNKNHHGGKKRKMSTNRDLVRRRRVETWNNRGTICRISCSWRTIPVELVSR